MAADCWNAGVPQIGKNNKSNTTFFQSSPQFLGPETGVSWSYVYNYLSTLSTTSLLYFLGEHLGEQEMYCSSVVTHVICRMSLQQTPNNLVVELQRSSSECLLEEGKTQARHPSYKESVTQRRVLLFTVTGGVD